MDINRKDNYPHRRIALQEMTDGNGGSNSAEPAMGIRMTKDPMVTIKSIVFFRLPGFQIKRLQEHDYSLQFDLCIDADRVTVIIYHDKKGVVNYTSFQNQTTEDIRIRCKQALDLTFRALRFAPKPTSALIAVPVTTLKELLLQKKIVMEIIKEYTDYSKRFLFTRGTESCKLLLFFDAEGKFSKTGDSSGSESLLSELRSYLVKSA